LIVEEELPTTNQQVIEDDIVIETNLEISREEENADADQIFVVVEKMPEFPGGEDSLYSYTAKNLTYPPEAREKGIQGTVYVSFVVEADGSVTDPRVLRGIGGGCDEMALELVKNMPRWVPGKQRGKPIRVQFTLPVKFRLK
jgi:protein TonB